jgi:hypothetical protein
MVPMWIVAAFTSTATPAATLDYEAPEACPGADRFADEVSARLGRMVFTDTAPMVAVRIGDGAPAWGSLEVAGGIRRVQGEDCARVFDSLIAAAAVVLDTERLAPLARLAPVPAPIPAPVPPVDHLLREPPPFGSVHASEWIVRFESGTAMDTPSFLRTTEAPEYLEVRRQLQRRTVHAAALGSGGSFLLVVGLYALPTTLVLSTPPYPSLPPEVPIAVGAGMLLGSGLVAAAVPKLLRIRRQQRDPSLVLTAERADSLIEEYNAIQDGL